MGQVVTRIRALVPAATFALGVLQTLEGDGVWEGMTRRGWARPHRVAHRADGRRTASASVTSADGRAMLVAKVKTA